MANYRVLEICNGQKIRIKYLKENNNIRIEIPSSGDPENDYTSISGPPENIMTHLHALEDIIEKLVPTEKMPAGELEVSSRELKEPGDSRRVMLNDTQVTNVVEALAGISMAADKITCPGGTIMSGINEIKKTIPGYRPEDASDLLTVMNSEAEKEFQSDIAKWAIEKRKSEMKAPMVNKTY